MNIYNNSKYNLINSQIYIILISGLFIRISLSLFDTYYGSPGSTGDATRFHNCAKYIVGFVISDADKITCDYYYYPYTLSSIDTYVTLLKYVYLIFGPNQFIGNLASVLFWLFSSILILKILKQMNISDNKILIILIFFSFSPSSIIFTSVTLRESMQLFLITYLGYLLVHIFIFKEKIIINFLLIVITLFFLNTLHHYFYVLSIILGILIFFYYIVALNKIIQMFIYMFLFMIIFIFFTYFISFDELAEKILNYIHGSITGSRNLWSLTAHQLLRSQFIANADGFFYSRAQYIFESTYCAPTATTIIHTEKYSLMTFKPSIQCSKDFSLSFFLFKFYPLLIFKYFFEPIPLLSNLRFSDYILFFENIIRFLLVLYFITNILFKNYNKLIFLLFSFYILIEILFASGTTNWGTASRHHIVTHGLICIFALTNITNIKYINEKN